MLINEQKFMITITTIDDPGCNSQIQNLKVMNEGLKLAVAELIGAEEEIVAKDLAASTQNKVANNFIDLTIARLLGGNDDNKNDSGETSFQIDLSLEDEKMEKATSATPISLNKRSRMLCDTNIGSFSNYVVVGVWRNYCPARWVFHSNILFSKRRSVSTF